MAQRSWPLHPEKCSTFHSNPGHYKEDSNVHFILGNTGHALRGSTVKLLTQSATGVREEEAKACSGGERRKADVFTG